MIRSRPLAMLLPALAILLPCAAARATGSVPESPLAVLRQMTEHPHAQDRAFRRAPAASEDLDQVPPVLAAFSMKTAVDVLKPFTQASFDFVATDAWSGVKSGYAYARGPSGQMISTTFGDALPLPRKAGQGIFPMNRYLEPGTWSVVSATLSDAAGNIQRLDGAALAALGNTSFQVANASGGDTVPPVLLRLSVRTPEIVLGAVTPGTAQYPVQAVVALEIQDTAQGKPSGLAWAYGLYCLKGGNPCFSISVPTHPGTSPGVTHGTVLAFGAPSDAHAPAGTYHLYQLTLADVAGNITQYPQSDAPFASDAIRIVYPE